MSDMMDHAAIVPLIGGMALGATAALGMKPEYLLSYSPFAGNDQHAVNYLSRPYFVLDRGERHPKRVSLVTALCPCAGLSALSPVASSDSHNNEWMYRTAEHVLGEMKPKIFLGENAPQLAGKIGKPVRERLRKIGRDNGYSMSMLLTDSLLHGIGQVRNRSFYFFWEGDRVPMMRNIRKQHTPIEQVILDSKQSPDPMMALTNEKTPSQDPLYRYVLEEIEHCTHAEFAARIPRTIGIMDHIEKHTDYAGLSTWLTERQFHRASEKAQRWHDKLQTGANIMRKNIEVPKDRITAFVGHVPSSLTHPVEDRFLTIREALTIMRLPGDFELLGGRKNLNHICQNVPLTTAADIVEEAVACADGREWIQDPEDIRIFDNRKEPRVKSSQVEDIFA